MSSSAAWIATEPFTDGIDTARLEEDLVNALKERLGLTCVEKVLTPGSMPRTEVGKARRLARWQGGDPPLLGL